MPQLLNGRAYLLRWLNFIRRYVLFFRFDENGVFLKKLLRRLLQGLHIFYEVAALLTLLTSQLSS